MNKVTDEIYHGYATRYANGKRKPIDFLSKKRQLLVGPFKVNKITLQK